MSASDSVILGVLSGIIASFSLFLLTLFFQKILIPWYRELIYSGIDISGDWHSKVTNPSGNIQDFSMKIYQKANRVKCLINIAKEQVDGAHLEIKSYTLKGNIEDRFLAVNGRVDDDKALGFHSELLEVVGNGKQMEGCRIWYSVTNKKIISDNISWHRI